MNEETSQVEIQGQIDRITYSNEETGFTVARLNVHGNNDPVTVVGNFISPTPGEILVVRGFWTEHPRFGRQFSVTSHSIKIPATIEGIKKYLGSGLIKGIGPVMASRIVKRFGKETIDIIENRTEELRDIEGVGPKRIEMIKDAWQEQREIRDLMIFLQSHGVGSGYAVKIFKRYGHGSLSILKRNPYRLATDIHGIGFLTSDSIADKLGFDKKSPMRAKAGVLYMLNRLADEGHVFFPMESLIDKCFELMEIDRDIIVGGIDSLFREDIVMLEEIEPDAATPGKIIQNPQSNFHISNLDEDSGVSLDTGKVPDARRRGERSEAYMTYAAGTNDRRQQSRWHFDGGSGVKAIYLSSLHTAEQTVCHDLARLTKTPKKIREIKTEKAIQWVQQKIGLRLAEKQKEALIMALSEKIMVITGGPGTGKTTIIKALIKIFMGCKARISLSAPTGRASKRMSEATGYPASTIHRLLEYSPQQGGFQRTRDNPLEADVLILDEVSMIDTNLMYNLLMAVPSGAVLIMVGDVNQLPSVGPGSVLKDIINSKRIAVTELNEIFRQAEASKIILNAHKINRGIIPELGNRSEGLEDFYYIEQEDPEHVVNIIRELVSKRIPDRFNMDPVNDIQILAPMHKGLVGTGNLNQVVQQTLNPSGYELTRGDRSLRINDKVMQVRNNYDKDVFNGDMGRITSIDPENQELTISFDNIPVPYNFSDLDEIMLAYAISVHKSQGSEYPAVIMPILTQHYLLLQRNLIYTGVTRGKQLVIIIGSKKALAMGIKNDKIMRRYTYLKERLMSSIPERPFHDQ